MYKPNFLKIIRTVQTVRMNKLVYQVDAINKPHAK